MQPHHADVPDPEGSEPQDSDSSSARTEGGRWEREPSAATGQVLGGRFVLGASLGAGATGRVFRAEDRERGVDCAVKALWSQGKNQSSVGDFRRIFHREVGALTRLYHPNVVNVLGYGSEQDPWVAMELVPGPSLSTVLADDGRLPLDEAVAIVRQVCAALQHAHEQGVVHRDVKPANVLVASRNPLLVKLANFGLAKSHDDTNHTAEGVLVGTPQYMAPELFEGQRATPSSDLYAVGVLLFRLATGTTPFRDIKGLKLIMAKVGTPPPTLAAILGEPVPPPLEAALAKCLAKDPHERHVSAHALSAALEHWQDEGVAEGSAPATLSSEQASSAPQRRVAPPASLDERLSNNPGAWWAAQGDHAAPSIEEG